MLIWSTVTRIIVKFSLFKFINWVHLFFNAYNLIIFQGLQMEKYEINFSSC
jgi:hypothetical protein